MPGTFLKQKGNYRNLIAYQKAEFIYDITYFLPTSFLTKETIPSTKWCKRLAVEARQACSRHNESAYYRKAINSHSSKTIANIAITLIHQEDVFLRKLIDRLQSDFPSNGGIKEQMHKARIEYRNKLLWTHTTAQLFLTFCKSKFSVFTIRFGKFAIPKLHRKYQ